MPRFWRFFCGPRVTVSPHVIERPRVAAASRSGSEARRDRRPRPRRTIAWHGAIAHRSRLHREHLLQQRQLVPGVAQTFRRLGLFQISEQLAELAQRLDRIASHAERHAARRAEEVREHRDRMAFRLLEQERGTAGLQHAVADFGDLEPRIDFDAHALQLTEPLELREKSAQVA